MFKILPIYIIAAFLLFNCLHLTAQETLSTDTSLVKKDTLISPKDTVRLDSVSVKKDQPFNSKVSYVAEDSIRFSLSNKKIYMYKNSVVNYDDIELKSERVDFDMDSSVVHADGIRDSVGNLIGKPHFKKSSEEFDANKLSYNFKTQKGIIHDIKSEQEGGYLHAEKTKRMANGNVNMINGKYTTCDADHPHFYLSLTKAVATDNQIVSGPAYIVMEDIPLPIGIPFGFFPKKKNSTSGILIPTYGEEASRGFFLRNGGYYFALSDYTDLRLTADIYSKGTWGLMAANRYVKRYKFDGSFNFRYYKNRYEGTDGVPVKSTDFSVQWTHAQSAQANPYRRFSASVNYSSQKFDRMHNYTNANLVLNNQKQSSISYNQSWPNNSPVNLSVNLRHSQNSTNNSVDLTLPSMSFNVDRIYLFRGKDGGSGKWYDDFAISYTSSLENSISGHEDSLFNDRTIKRMKNGFRHSVPFGTSFKIWKLINLNLSPSLNYNGVLYSNYIRKGFNMINDSTGFLYVDTVQRFTYAHGFSPSISLSTTPTFYGTFNFKNSKIKAIRHILRPTVGVSFVPSLKGIVPDYSDYYYDLQNRQQKYSRYEQNIYGTPSSSNTKSGSVSLGLFNNLEMKVRSEKDTLKGERKIKIIESLNLGTSYNVFADSMGWSVVSISGNTTIVEGLSVNVSGAMDMYAYRKTVKGNSVSYGRINKFEIEDNKRLARLTDMSLSTGYTFQSKQGTSTDKDKEKNPRSKDLLPDEYDYFDIPWRFTFSYDFSYRKPYDITEFMHTFRFDGDFSLTKNWKINFSSGYDVKANKFSYTTIGINRDLHCWVMSFNCSPFGETKFYNFQINVKSALLQDIKYDKRKSNYDYMY